MLEALVGEAEHELVAPDLLVAADLLEDLVGRALFDAFPDNPEDPAATGASSLRASRSRGARNAG